MSVLLVGGSVPVGATPPVMVQNYETDSLQASVWVINIPNANASIKLASEGAFEGKRCLKLHYHPEDKAKLPLESDLCFDAMQVDTYLRIRASEKTYSAGLLSSLKNDGSGIKVTLPCYFDCRFLEPNAVGTWPAF